MFSTLLESRRARAWPLGDGALSLAVHLAVAAFVVAATADAHRRLRDERGTVTRAAPAALRYVELREAAPPGQARPASAMPRPRRPLVAPREIPTTIPEPAEVDVSALLAIDVPSPGVDLTGLASRAEDFAAFRPGWGVPRFYGNPERLASGAPFHPAEVERMALLLPDSPSPRFPSALLHAQIGGDVVLQFVVDSTGTADLKSVRVLASTHELFTRAVRAVLPRLHYLPAEIGGRRVRVLVQQPFSFVVR